jgi:hypothetical protein
MPRTKHYKKRKSRRTIRNIRTKRNNKKISRKNRKMKGGGLPFVSEISDMYNTVKYNISNAVNISMVNPTDVAPDVKGGDNPLPYKQLGAADDINSYNIAATSTTASISSPAV